MHPYVKQHKLLQFVLSVFTVMLISCSANSHSCNAPVKMLKIYSQIAKGNLRVEESKVVANSCNEDCASDELYTVTIHEHRVLIYHIQSKKFICWNKLFTKLVARRNPLNLKYCTFEDKVSDTRPKYAIRYTTKYRHGNKEKEIEMRFNQSGLFATSKYIRKCRNKQKFSEKNKHPELCSNPNLLAREGPCISRLAEFCDDMKKRRHKIPTELTNLCRNQWNKNNY